MFDKEEVRSRVDICEVVGQRVKLTGTGNERKGKCPFHEDKDPSFTVNGKKGFFHCFGCGAHGDVFDFVQKMDGVDFKTALERLGSQAGMLDRGPAQGEAVPETRSRLTKMGEKEGIKKGAVKEADPGKLKKMYRPVEEGSAVWKWLTEERGIDEDTIRVYGIGEGRQYFGEEAGERDCVVFPSEVEGDVRFLKFRDIAEKHNTRPAPKKDEGGRKMLFGRQAVPADAAMLVLCEGEIDALSWRQMGYPAVSVPFGAQGLTKMGNNPNDEWLEHDHDWLAGFERIYLAFDNDDAGWEAARAIAPRLGRERVWVVTYPEELNDANGLLTEGAVREEFEELIHCARDCDPVSLRRASSYREDLYEQMFGEGLRFSGDEMPFAVPFKLRMKEVTVWTGYSKHGKSVFLNWMLMWLAAKYGRKCCQASLEMSPVFTLENAARQVLGKGKPDGRAEFDRVVDWLDAHVWLYDHVGVAYSEDIFKVFKYAVRKYGVKHLLIDSIMKLGDVLEDDNASQKDFMNKAAAFADENECHLHIVAHSKKATQKYPEEKYWPKKHDVLGSVHITDIANNTVCVYRNRQKENELSMLRVRQDALLAAGVPASDEKFAEIESEMMDVEARNDAMFIVEGQRGGSGETPIKQLYFDHGVDASWRYSDERGEYGGDWLEEERDTSIESMEVDDDV